MSERRARSTMPAGARRLALFMSSMSACGPDHIEVAEHDEVCGQESPLRILELDPDRLLATVLQHSHEDGRRILRIGYLDESSDESYPKSETFEFWSVGSCGESPRRISDPTESWWTLDHWPELVFECDGETGELEIVDPTGDRPPNLVFATNECNFDQTPWGLVGLQAHDDDLGALVLLPYPEDPWTQTSAPQVLIDPVRIRAVPTHVGPAYHDVLAVFDDEVFAVTPEDELVHFSLIDGTTTTEAASVHEFEVSRDLRWLIWQDVVLTGGDDEWPAGANYLRDREMSTTARLADAPLTGAVPRSLTFAEQGVARLQLGYLYKQPERLYHLPDLASFDLPLGVTTHNAIPDGRLLVGDAFRRGSFALIDPSTGTGTQLFEHAATILVREDGFEILQDVHCCITQDQRAQGPLWFADLDATRELLAHRATSGYRFLADERLLTTVDVDSKWRGDLIIVDPDDLVEQRVDDHVVMRVPDLDDDDTMLYGVSDHERTGVWLARIAPR